MASSLSERLGLAAGTAPFRDGPITPGQWFWANKVNQKFSPFEQYVLAAESTRRRNKNHKVRPWLCLEVLPCGKVLLLGGTKRNSKVWEGLNDEEKKFFLPVTHTPSAGRPVVQVETQFTEVFDGKQLLYLGSSAIAAPAILGNCFAKVSEATLKLIAKEHAAARGRVIKAIEAIKVNPEIKFSEVLAGLDEGIEDNSTALTQNAATQKAISNYSAPNNGPTEVNKAMIYYRGGGGHFKCWKF
ncbi:hypothetical protein RUND412_002025 [Rhizina undulata]